MHESTRNADYIADRWKIVPVARFGDNVRAFRKALRLSQKETAARLWNDDGSPMGQAHLSKIEGMEWAPRPDTVQRIAEGLAKASGQPISAVFDQLLDGVSSRFDAVQARRAAPVEPPADDLDRIRELIDRLPPEKRQAVVDALEAYALQSLKTPKKRGA